jgi:carbamoyltransferase
LVDTLEIRGSQVPGAVSVIVLGVWDGHDAGAALLVDARLVAAVNEERFSRRKLEIRFPADSIACCLRMAGLRPCDVDAVACSTSDIAKTLGRFWPGSKERYYAVRRRKTLPGAATRLTRAAKLTITQWPTSGATKRLSRFAIHRELRALGLGATEVSVEDHHRCHALTAAIGSGWPAATVLTIDGLGDGLSSTVGVYRDGSYEPLAVTPAWCSLGVLFEQVTNLLNMRELEDEGKVMALADYASPVPDAENPMLELMQVDGLRLNSSFKGRSLRRHLERLLWRHPNEQFAYMAQRLVERIGSALAGAAVAATGIPRVALAGGVASNIKMSRRILARDDVEDVYVFPHMGDGGLAVGAAWSHAVARGIQPATDIDPRRLGPAYDDAVIVAAARQRGLTLVEPPDLPADVARRLAHHQVVLWFQGAMEYGPRALGNRSVLARPDSVAIRDRINQLLKKRTWYQPFCPSILESDARAVFEDLKGAPNRDMTMAYTVCRTRRPALCGVSSLDGACRPQIVSDDEPGLFGELLREVRRHWGLAALLNTSLNIHGEPLVNTPDQAFDVYERSGADALVIGRHLVGRADVDSLAVN